MYNIVVIVYSIFSSFVHKASFQRMEFGACDMLVRKQLDIGYLG